jgi:hypothetical protein
VIPPHDPASGCLPPGRYLTSLNAVRDRYVLDDEFEYSTTRIRNWAGLADYLAAWDVAETQLGVKVLLGVWIAGSFVTNKPNPGDIDITPIYDAAVVPTIARKPGVGKIRQLIGDRDWIKRHFFVEAFPLGWNASGSSLFPDKLPLSEKSYLLAAGGLNDWWQRETRAHPSGMPADSDSYAYKGFLEVLR